MQDDQLNAFLEAIRHDKELQEKLRLPDADPVSIAKEHGFFLGDHSTLLSELYLTEELDDEQLEHVNGGGGLNPISPYSNGIKMIYKLNPENSMRNLGMHC